VFRQTRELVRFPGSGDGLQDNTPPAKLPAPPQPLELPLIDLARDAEASDEGVFLDRQPLWFKLAGAVAALYGAYLIGWSNAEPAHGTVALQPPARAAAAMAPAPPPTEPATALASTIAPPPVAPSTTTRRLSNDEVREIQVKLEALGHDPGPVDGIFGPQTVAAVKRYEVATGRDPTGAIDLSLLERLRQGP
jgi:Putative peptidoglycan binding domain